MTSATNEDRKDKLNWEQRDLTNQLQEAYEVMHCCNANPGKDRSDCIQLAILQQLSKIQMALWELVEQGRRG